MPQNKEAIMEEFSGVRCVNCPAGHQVIDQIFATNPTGFHIVTFMPNNSSYTPPYAGDPDLQRSYPAAYYSTPYCGNSRFMPSAFINRREWSSGAKLSSRTLWANAVNTIINEPSPLNVGVYGYYNETTMMLEITVEVYYTSTVTDQHSLYVTLAESGIMTQQSGASGQYEQKHVFREAFTGQWGDAIATTVQGDLHTYTFTFDNSTTNYDMSQAEVMAYVENKTNEEIVSGFGNDVSSAPPVAVAPAQDLNVGVFPNPFSDATAIVYNLNNTSEVSLSLTDLTGKQVTNIDLGEQATGEHRFDLNVSEQGLASGIYIMQLRAGEQVATQRLAVQ
ncbi:MAG: Omp28-related outer membrane protein [Bacteroidota bacterium]